MPPLVGRFVDDGSEDLACLRFARCPPSLTDRRRRDEIQRDYGHGGLISDTANCPVDHHG